MMLSPPQDEQVSILVVDDELTNRLTMEEAVRAFGKILKAENGTIALQLAQQYVPDVILLDIEMPGMNGFEVCKQLKENPKTKDIAVIFVTSHDELEVEYYSLAQGGIDFISKPVDFRLCQLRVQNQLMLQQHAKALKMAKDDLRDLIHHLPVFISYWTPNWVNHFCNDLGGQWFSGSADLMHGLKANQILPDALMSQVLLYADKESDKTSTFTVQLPDYKDDLEYVQVYLTPRKDEGELVGYLLTLVDITTIKRTKQALRNEKERLKITLNSIGDAVIATDLDANITFMNPIAERMTGWMSKDAIGQHIETVMDLRDADSQQTSFNPILLALQEERTVAMALNIQLRSQDGTIYRVEDSAAPIRDDNNEITGAIVVFHDVSESVAMAVKMSHLANHDQLTDLPNRILLHDRLTHALRISHTKGSMVALFLIDIDHFKYLNDSLGHHHGDILIKQTSKRLESLIDPDSTLARVGGDEFVLVVPNLYSSSAIDSIASNIVQCMHEPFRLDGKEYNLSVSVGISINPKDANTEESLIRHADVAMYRAKQQGRNGYCYFSQELEAELLQRHQIELLLRDAIDNDALEVLYQPQLELKTGKIIGAEALVRLKDKQGNYLSPLTFIPLAEETGLIVKLGHQVLTKACLAARRWQQNGYPVRVAVNIAAKQFSNDSFFDEIAEVLESTSLPSRYLELEVTESALMHDFDETRKILNDLSELGISIAIDDFGTGYSSLSYLKMFPVDVLKIDQSFVKDMQSDQQSLDIVKTIVSLAHSLKLTLVGEGIEQEAHKQTLMELDCDLGQGFLFSKPLIEQDFVALLEQQNRSKG